MEASKKPRRKLLPVVENRMARLFAREWAPSEALRMREEDCKSMPALLKSMVEFFGRSDLEKLHSEAMEREERLLEFCLVLAAANPKSDHAAAVDFAARNLGL